MQRPNLPPGYRFCPSDLELIIHYLDKKVKNEHVSCNFAVNDFDLYSKHPWEIWNMFGGNNLVSELDKDQGLFFFMQLRKRSGKDSRFSRSFGGGTWHGEDVGVPIETVDTKLPIGLKKRFTYKNPKSPHYGKWMMYEFSLIGHSTDYVLCQLKMKDKDKKSSESEPAPGLPKHNNKERRSEATASGGLPKQNNTKRKSEATTSGKNPKSKKPKPSFDDAPETGVSKSHWANSELIAADPNVIDLTGDDVGDEILWCLEEYEKATMNKNNVIISYASEEEHSGVHGLIECLEYRSQAPPPEVPSTDHCEEAVKRIDCKEQHGAVKGIDCKEQHGVDKLVGETQSESGVGEVLSNLMHEIDEVEIGSLAGFLSIPDKEVGWLDHRPTLADIFPPTLADMGTNCVPKQPAINQPI